MTDLSDISEEYRDVESWASRSRKGEVCGIFGCAGKATTKCVHCGNHYCDDHKFVMASPAHQFKFPESVKELKGIESNPGLIIAKAIAENPEALVATAYLARNLLRNFGIRLF